MSHVEPARELDAFKLRNPLPPSAIPGRALCVCQHEDFVYLGLDSGLVCSYAVEARRQGRREEDRRWNEVLKKKLSKRPIAALRCIDPVSSFSTAYGEAMVAANKPNPLLSEQALLWLLSDGRLQALHPHTLDVVIDLTQLKDVALFAVDLLPPHHLVVHSKLKRKLQIVSYSLSPSFDPAKSRHEVVRELPITDVPLSLQLAGDWLVVAYRTKYVQMSAHSGEVKELAVPLEGVCPCILLCSETEQLLSSNMDIGLFLSQRGDPTNRSAVDWGGASPFEMHAVDHYVVGLFTEEPYAPVIEDRGKVVSERKTIPQSTAAAQFTSIRIASLLDQRIVQTLPIPNPLTASASRDKLVLLTGQGDLLALSIVSLEEQIAQYMDASRPDEALALLQRTQPDTVKLLEFETQAGFVMLRDLQLTAAFSHFLRSNVDPRELLCLFSDLVVPDRQYERKQRIGNMEELIEKGRKKAEQRSEDKRYKQVLGLSSRQIQRQAKLLLAGFLWERREKGKLWDDDDIAWVETALLFLAIDFLDDDTVQQPPQQLTAASQQTAVAAPAKPAVTQQQVQLSTTTFPFSLQQLLFPANQVITSEAETFLIVKRRFNALASLYLSQQQPRKALDVWVRMGTGEFVEKDGKAGGGDGVEQTVELLRRTGDDAVLWEFAEWVLLRDKEAGLRIFTSDDRRQQLPHEKVLNYLKRVNGKRGRQRGDEEGGGDIVELYLEHIVMQGKIHDPVYHTQLVTTYLRKILSLMQQQQQAQAGGAAGQQLQQPDGADKKKKKRKQALPALQPRPVPGSEPAPLGPLRRKLYRFLQTSSWYDAEAVLSQLLLWTWPKEERKPEMDDKGVEQAAEAAAAAGQQVESVHDGLWLPAPKVIARTELPLIEEMILLLAKLGLDEKVLKLFIYGLRDHAGAAQYCLHTAKDRAKAAAQELHERVVRESEERREKRELEEATAPPIRAPAPAAGRKGSRRQSLPEEEEEDDGDDDEDIMDEDLDEDQLRARQRRRRQRAQREQLRQQREEQERIAREAEEQKQKQAEAAASAPPPVSLPEDDRPHPGDVFLHLVNLYFSDPFYALFASPEEQQRSAEDSELLPPPTAYQYAVDIITLYHPHMDPVKAVKSIPPYVPIPPLAPLFSRLLPRTLHQRRHVQVIKSLAKTQHLDVESQSWDVRGRGLLVGAGTRCLWCKKPLTDYFVGWPVKQGEPDWDKRSRTFRGGAAADADDGSTSPAVRALKGRRGSDGGGAGSGLTAGGGGAAGEENGLAYLLVHSHCALVYDSDRKERMQRQGQKKGHSTPVK